MPSIIYTDLDLNFINNPITGDISKNNGDWAVIRAVENLVLLSHYEYPFNPGIGSNVYKLLFENLTALTANALAKEVKNIIANYETRASVYYINAIPNFDQNGYDLRVEFFINNNPNPVAITTFLQRL